MTTRYTDERAPIWAETFVRTVLEGVPEFFRAVEWALIVGALLVAARKFDTWPLWLAYSISWLMFCLYVALRLARLLPDQFDIEARFRHNYFTRAVASILIIGGGTFATFAATQLAYAVISSLIPV